METEALADVDEAGIVCGIVAMIVLRPLLPMALINAPTARSSCMHLTRRLEGLQR